MTNRTRSDYGVLSPWATADPKPLRGIMPRFAEISGKKIGLYATSKRAPQPILTAVERKLKERFPSVETSWYVSTLPYAVMQVEGPDKVKFKEWLKGVDAVITAVGD
jgi:hypothetical protein